MDAYRLSQLDYLTGGPKLAHVDIDGKMAECHWRRP